MEKSPKPTAAAPHAEPHPLPIHLRPATMEDIPALVPLVLRLKRLNEEFDPLLKVRPDAEAKARELLESDLKNPKCVVLAAEGLGGEKGKVVGVVRAEIHERPFYQPELEGLIRDIYLLPLYRRHGAGEFLLDEVTRRLKEKGAGIVTAEFPTQNEIATKFYAKRGFRPIVGQHARSV